VVYERALEIYARSIDEQGLELNETAMGVPSTSASEPTCLNTPDGFLVTWGSWNSGTQELFAALVDDDTAILSGPLLIADRAPHTIHPLSLDSSTVVLTYRSDTRTRYLLMTTSPLAVTQAEDFLEEENRLFSANLDIAQEPGGDVVVARTSDLQTSYPAITIGTLNGTTFSSFQQVSPPDQRTECPLLAATSSSLLLSYTAQRDDTLVLEVVPVDLP
jgi:hypothetical protein